MQSGLLSNNDIKLKLPYFPYNYPYNFTSFSQLQLFLSLQFRLMTNNGTTPLSNNRNWFFVIQNGPTALYKAYLTMVNALATR